MILHQKMNLWAKEIVQCTGHLLACSLPGLDTQHHIWPFERPQELFTYSGVSPKHHWIWPKWSLAGESKFLWTESKAVLPLLAAPGGRDHAAHLHEQLPPVQWAQRAGGTALCTLRGDTWPPRPVPALPADCGEGRWEICEEMPGYGDDRGRCPTGICSLSNASSLLLSVEEKPPA